MVILVIRHHLFRSVIDNSFLFGSIKGMFSDKNVFLWHEYDIMKLISKFQVI